MTRSEKLSQSAFRHLLGGILATGATATEGIWATALLLSDQSITGFIMAVLTCATATLAALLLRESCRLMQTSIAIAEAEKRAAIRPRLFQN